MNLREANTLLGIVKQKGPLTKPWFCYTDEGILLEAWPLGFARGSMRVEDIFTMHPHFQYSALFDGQGIPHHMKVPKMGPYHLWEQEAYVYYLEMRAMARKMVEGLETAPFLPRVGEYDGVGHRQRTEIRDNATPCPEDFHLYPPGVSWGYGGVPDVSAPELERIKTGFCKVLDQFAYH